MKIRVAISDYEGNQSTFVIKVPKRGQAKMEKESSDGIGAKHLNIDSVEIIER